MGSTWSQMFSSTSCINGEEFAQLERQGLHCYRGYSGVGRELTRILFEAGGRVYVAGRSEAEARKVIEDIKISTSSPSPGDLEFLYLDLGDLTTIKPTADDLKSKETRLDALWNNAGVNLVTGKTSQNFEKTIRMNCVGQFLLT